MKFAVITGANGGMGKKAVELLSKNGYTVFALDINKGEEMENVISISADVTDTKSLNSALKIVKENTSRLDAIIHFAGVYALDSFVEISEESLEKIFKINFFGAVNVNKIFLPLLSSGSKIVITTSELAPLSPLPFTGIYAVTKGALDKYAYSLKMELQLLGISVSVIRAGAVNTGMLNASMKALEEFCQKTRLYKCNAERFKKIVFGIEAKNISAEKLAGKTLKILNRKKPKFNYNINRNKLLLILNALPKRMQFYVIRKILKSREEKK